MLLETLRRVRSAWAEEQQKEEETVDGYAGAIEALALSNTYFRPTDYNAATEGSIEFTTSIPSLVGTWQQIHDEEPFTDANGNHKWDAGESYTDTNGDGSYTPRTSGMDNLLPY